MKVMPTPDGTLQIQADEPGDWELLVRVTRDAAAGSEDLSQRLAALITDSDFARDWQEYVRPDLQSDFASAVQQVATAIAAARLESGGGPGCLWITGHDAWPWYSALNQARLALEDQFHFGPTDRINDLASLPPATRSAFLRSQFYCAIQTLLLEHVLP